VNFSTSSPLILIEGYVSNFIYSFSKTSNVTFKGVQGENKGALIHGRPDESSPEPSPSSSPSYSVDIYDSVFTNISSGNSLIRFERNLLSSVQVDDVVVSGSGITLTNPGRNGGFLYVGSSDSVAITNTNVSFISGGALGGAVYLANCLDILVGGCSFMRVSSSGDGGVLYFSENTYFSIIDSNFSSCSSNQHGGVICNDCDPLETLLSASFKRLITNQALHSVSDFRVLRNVSFDGNIAILGGNDIYESSSNGASLYAWSSSSVYDCRSVGSGARFVVHSGSQNFKFDCLLFGTCSSGIISVINGTGSKDHPFCGVGDTEPCLSVGQGVAVVQSGGTVGVADGSYTTTHIVLTRKIVTVKSVGIGSPQISLEANPDGYSSLCEIEMGTLTLEGFRIIYVVLENEMNVRLFVVSRGSAVNFDRVVFTGKDLIASVPKAFIECMGGVVLLKSCNFTSIVSNGSSLITYSLVNTYASHIAIEDCIFEGVESKGNHSSMISAFPANAYNISISNTKFRESKSLISVNGGLMFFVGTLSSVLTLGGLVVDNVTVGSKTNGGVVNVQGSVGEFSVGLGSSFTTIHTANKGGVIYAALGNNGYSVDGSLGEVVFKNCSASYGGAIYIEDFGAKWLKNIRFTLNTAAVNGNDIYHNNSDWKNTWQNLVSTVCSSSHTTRFAILGGDKKSVESLDALIGDCSSVNLYVGSTGLDTNPGTQDRPCRTIRGVVSKASGSEPFVTVAGGSFDDNSTSVGGGFIYIRGGNEGTTASPYTSFSFGSADAFDLFTVTSGHLELSYLNAVPSSKGSFVTVSNTGGHCVLYRCSFNTPSSTVITSPFAKLQAGTIVINQCEATGVSYGDASFISLVVTEGSVVTVTFIRTSFTTFSSQSTTGGVFFFFFFFFFWWFFFFFFFLFIL
jgi:hypothetical protein